MIIFTFSCVFGGVPIESRDRESLEGVSASHKHAVASLNTGETYTYDANGNTLAPHCVWCSAGVTQRVEGGLTYTQTFRQAQCDAFDTDNRMISVTVSGQTTQFVYDGDGNLVKKIKPDNSKTIYPSTGSGQAWEESTKWTKLLAEVSSAP